MTMIYDKMVAQVKGDTRKRGGGDFDFAMKLLNATIYYIIAMVMVAVTTCR